MPCSIIRIGNRMNASAVKNLYYECMIFASIAVNNWNSSSRDTSGTGSTLLFGYFYCCCFPNLLVHENVFLLLNKKEIPLISYRLTLLSAVKEGVSWNIFVFVTQFYSGDFNIKQTSLILHDIRSPISSYYSHSLPDNFEKSLVWSVHATWVDGINVIASFPFHNPPYFYFIDSF